MKTNANPVAIIQNATVPIDQLTPHPRNYNQHTTEQIRRLALSLRRFGQPRSIVIWQRDGDDYWIIAGHGVVQAAMTLAWREIRADILPRAYSEADALAFMVADNEIARLSEPDEAALVALLQEQADAGYALESLGSSQDELALLLLEIEESTAAPVEHGTAPEAARKLGTPNFVRILIAVADLDAIERALLLTDATSRGAALTAIAAHYLAHPPPEGIADAPG